MKINLLDYKINNYIIIYYFYKYYYNLIFIFVYFYSYNLANSGIEPDLTDHEAVVLPLHYFA